MLHTSSNFLGSFYTEISLKNTFLTNLCISEAFFCLKTTQKIRRGMQDHLYLVFFSVIFFARSESLNV